MSTHIRGAGLLQLKGLVLLQSLNLQCTQLGDEGLACITSMSSLRELDWGSPASLTRHSLSSG